MHDAYYAQQKIDLSQRLLQPLQTAAAPRPGSPPPAGTIDANLSYLGERLGLAIDLLVSLEEHLAPVLADIPVQAHQWPPALEPTCALAQQIGERTEQVERLSARLSAVLERLAL
jgi:hypothetical protein